MGTAVIPTSPPPLVPPRDLVDETSVWAEQVNSIEIIDQVSYDVIAETLIQLAALERKIIEHHKPIKEATHLAHKAAVKAETDMLAPVKLARSKAQLKIVGWTQEQERIRREREEEARREQERQAEQIQLQTAVSLHESGASEEEVQAVLETPVNLPAPVVQRTFTPAAGVTTTTRWSANVVDLAAFVKHVAAKCDDDPSVLTLVLGLEVDKKSDRLRSPALNKMAQAMESTLNIPGVRAVKDVGTRVGR